jgi:hypothetical protein
VKYLLLTFPQNKIDVWHHVPLPPGQKEFEADKPVIQKQQAQQ